MLTAVNEAHQDPNPGIIPVASEPDNPEHTPSPEPRWCPPAGPAGDRWRPSPPSGGAHRLFRRSGRLQAARARRIPAGPASAGAGLERMALALVANPGRLLRPVAMLSLEAAAGIAALEVE